MTSVDTRYAATLSASQPERASATAGHLPGAGAQTGRATDRPLSDIDWFSPAQTAEHRPVTISASATVAATATLDALASDVLSHIGEYTPD